MTLAVPGVAPAPVSPQNDAGPSAVDAGDGPGSFGKVLSSNLANPPDASTAPARADRIVSNGDGTDRVVNAGKPVPGRSTNGTPDATTEADPKHGGHAAGDGDDHDDAAGGDLAAQLALVSQWAARGAQGATGAPGGARSGGPGIKAQLDTVRGVAVDRTATAETLDPRAPAGFGATDPGTVPVGTVSSKSEDLRATLDATAASFDKLLVATASGSHAPLDASAAGTLLNAQVTTPSVSIEKALATVPDPALTAALREPVGTTAWSHEVGQAALRLAASDVQSASLHLNPEHLGPLDVRVRVDDGVAHLQFVAATAETRQALESSRATLDQMFGQQGLKLGEWSVGQQSQGRAFGDPTGANGGRASTRDESSADDGSIPVVARTIRAIGLVDTFA